MLGITYQSGEKNTTQGEEVFFFTASRLLLGHLASYLMGAWVTFPGGEAGRVGNTWI
jgi:hypothetical protein